MSSTRLRSEEIYRERVTSDSLFAARTRYPSSAIANNDNQQQQQQSGQEQQNISSALLQDDVFENDDLFGPPPLPSKSDSKRTGKSKVSSLFDDSDSGDELFSAASSGSRSQKSTDFHAAVSSNDRTKPVPKSGGLFDDDVNIFGGKDAPDVDIFGVASKPSSRDAAPDGLASVAPKSINGKSSMCIIISLIFRMNISLQCDNTLFCYCNWKIREFCFILRSKVLLNLIFENWKTLYFYIREVKSYFILIWEYEEHCEYLFEIKKKFFIICFPINVTLCENLKNVCDKKRNVQIRYFTTHENGIKQDQSI